MAMDTSIQIDFFLDCLEVSKQPKLASNNFFFLLQALKCWDLQSRATTHNKFLFQYLKQW